MTGLPAVRHPSEGRSRIRVRIGDEARQVGTLHYDQQGA